MQSVQPRERRQLVKKAFGGHALPGEVRRTLPELMGPRKEQLRRIRAKIAPKARALREIEERQAAARREGWDQFVLFYQVACLVNLAEALGLLPAGSSAVTFFQDEVRLRDGKLIKETQVEKYLRVAAQTREVLVMSGKAGPLGGIEVLNRIAQINLPACREYLWGRLGKSSPQALKRGAEAARKAEEGDRGEREVLRAAKAAVAAKSPLQGESVGCSKAGFEPPRLGWISADRPPSTTDLIAHL